MSRFVLFFIAIILSSECGGQNLPKTILWEVTKKGNNHKSYLFGTFHEVDPAFFESLKNTVSKFNSSTVLLLEEKQNTTTAILQRDSLLWTKDKWKQLLTNRQDSIFKAFSLKADDSVYYNVSPLVLSLQVARLYLQNFCDREPNTSYELMDRFIEKLAVKQKKQIQSLDKDQHEIIKNIETSLTSKQDSLYTSYGIHYMESMLNDDSSDCEILNEYKTFNLNYQLDADLALIPDHSPLLIERNKKWLPIIDKAFAKQNCFVAVGFKHLFYKQGLIQSLRALGYTVIPIPTV